MGVDYLRPFHSARGGCPTLSLRADAFSCLPFNVSDNLLLQKRNDRGISAVVFRLPRRAYACASLLARGETGPKPVPIEGEAKRSLLVCG